MTLLLWLGLAFAGAGPQGPDCSVVPGWTPQGASRLFEGENLFEYMNGNSEGYLIYGFARMRGATCVKGEDKLLIDISEMDDAESAYGIFSANRDARRGVEPIGASGQVGPRKALFVKDRFFVEIAAEREADHTATLRAFAVELEKKLPGTTTAPEALSWFPPDGGARLIPQSVLGIGVLKRGYAAQYEKVKAFVVTERSEEAAQAVMNKLRTRFGNTQPSALTGDAFEAQDQYLGHLYVFRKGRRVGGTAAAETPELAATLAKRVPE